VLVALGGGSLALGSHYNDVFTISGTKAQKATHLLQKNFPQEKNPVAEAGVTIAFKAPPGERLDSPKNSAAIDKVIKHIQDNLDGLIPGQRFGNPVTKNPELQKFIIETSTSKGLPEENAKKDAENLSLVSADGRIGFTAFSVDVAIPADVTTEQRHGPGPGRRPGGRGRRGRLW